MLRRRAARGKEIQSRLAERRGIEHSARPEGTLVNARISARSFARWRKVPGLARSLFGGIAGAQAQSAQDAARLAALGTRSVTSPGNLKLAARKLPADPAELERLRCVLAGRP